MTNQYTYRPATFSDYQQLLLLMPQLADFALPARRVAKDLWEGDAKILKTVLLEKAAVRFAEDDQNMVMPVIRRIPAKKYRWKIESAKLSRVANVERKLPRSYITQDGFGITKKAREYLLPLIQGEEYPPYSDGLPIYSYPKNELVTKKLPAFSC